MAPIQVPRRREDNSRQHTIEGGCLARQELGDSARSITRELQQQFLRALAPLVLAHSDVDVKPLTVDLALPLPPRIRVYLYTLVEGGSRKEFKAVLRVPGQAVDEYGSFDHSLGRIVLLVGYRADLDVFVLWDAGLHARFKNGGNIQVKDTTVYCAAALGRADQTRQLTTRAEEIVVACQSWTLKQAVIYRMALMGRIDRSQ